MNAISVICVDMALVSSDHQLQLEDGSANLVSLFFDKHSGV